MSLGRLPEVKHTEQGLTWASVPSISNRTVCKKMQPVVPRHGWRHPVHPRAPSRIALSPTPAAELPEGCSVLPRGADSTAYVAGTCVPAGPSLEPVCITSCPVYPPSGSRDLLAAIRVDLTGIIKPFSQLLGSMGHDSSFRY